MTRQQQGISYAAVLERAAMLVRYRVDAEALRELARIVTEIKDGSSDECNSDDFCNRIAAGFSVPPTSAGGPRQ